MQTFKKGFTLIELSIVLVIIGFLIAGIMLGQEMIKNSEIRQQVTQIDQINTGVNTFRLKYNCLPGDCATARNFFGGSSQPDQVRNGDGNGNIRGYWTGSSETTIDVNATFSSPGNSESGSVFEHLSAAGLWNMPAYNETITTVATIVPLALPEAKIRSRGGHAGVAAAYGQVYRQGRVFLGYVPGFSYIQTANHIMLTGCQMYEGSWSNSFGYLCGLNVDEAAALDGKIDDGKPYSGNMVIGGMQSPYYIPGAAAIGGYDNTTTCASAATGNYLSTAPTIGGNIAYRGCNPMIKGSF